MEKEVITPDEATILIQLLDTVSIVGHRQRAIMNHLVNKLELIKTFKEDH